MIEGHIYTQGRITKDYPAQMKSQIDRLPSDAQLIIHHVQSPGGDCYAAWNGYHEIMKIGKPIESIIEGEAQSMATFLAIAPANKVTILDPSTFMVHEPFFPEGAGGTVDELDAARTELDQIRQAMAEAYAKKTGKTVDLMLQMMKKTTRLNAAGAVKEGFVDTLVEPRRVAAELLDEMKKEFKILTTDFMGLFNKRVVATGPTAVDVKTTDGKTLNIQSEDGNFMNKPATLDGQPANGTYTLEDGSTLTCVNGIVTELKPVTPPEESAAQKMAKQLSDMQAQLAAMKAAEDAKAKMASDKAKVEDDLKKAQEAVKALEDKNKEVLALAKELEELKKTPAGSAAKPNEGMKPNRTPIGFKPSEPNAVAMDLTKAFINENMKWLHRHYPEGYFDNTPSMISILETSFSFTYPGILTTDIFYKPTLQAPALSDVFTIDQEIKFKKQYNLVTELNKIVRPYTGCGAAVAGDRQLITNAEVVTKEFQLYEGWCKDDFTAQLSGIYNNLAQEWLKTGEDQFDPAGTPIDKVIMTVLKDAAQRDIFRRAFFGDATSSDPDYNQFDGMFERNADSSGASNYCVTRSGTAVGNQNALGIGSLASGNALTYLGAAYATAPVILKDDPSATFWVTRSIWDNYYDSLIGNGAVTEQAFSNLQKGLETLTYKGYPVRPINLLDKFLLESDNPRTGTVRHIIMFTVKKNHILGVENGADLNKIDSWYEKKDQKRYYRGSFKLGYNYLHCDLTTMAF